MDYSRAVDLAQAYQTPPSYKPPESLEELAKCTDYPNTNSTHYQLKDPEPRPDNKLQSMYELVTVNATGHTIVAGNDYKSRRWAGSFCGWESATDIGDEEKASFGRQCESAVTALCYTMNDSLFVLGNDRGSIELWSTGNSIRGPGYSLYLVDNRYEHIGAITALDVFRGDDSHVISGSTDGCIKVWDYSEGDLHSSHTFHQAHTSFITSLATDTTQPSLAVSCSNDRSTLLWDLRELKPAKALFEGHDVPFSTVRWTDEANWNRLVAVGDVAGRVHFIDVRQPNVFLETVSCFDRKIQRISFHGKRFAVLANAPEVKFYDEHSKEIHVEQSATNYVRDLVWDRQSPDDAIGCTLLGWDSYVQHITIR
ncbi:protein valois [Anopheles darlingi]|uniref:protein valois n=1 Tax=Anopheles darlingi TaxID=43151 RepID=UPI0021002D93|nr:protein valois [Anopheles darlingi]XP_049537160.1 protein valois [Anopheles darlingi]XP_049537161.1 protein valois [Anopheles darlingi]